MPLITLMTELISFTSALRLSIISVARVASATASAVIVVALADSRAISPTDAPWRPGYLPA